MHSTPMVDQRLASAALLTQSGQTDLLILDLFDTLLIRRMPRATDVLLRLGTDLFNQGFLEEGYTPESFAAIRAQLVTPKASLEEIYASFPSSVLSIDSALLPEKERRIEETLCFANIEALALAQKAKEKGVRIVVMTSSPLGDSFLQDLLRKKMPDFPEPDLFLSPSGQKIDGMKGLIQKALDHFNIAPRSSLLISADWWGLCVFARQLGARIISLAGVDDDFTHQVQDEQPKEWGDRADLYSTATGDAGLTWLRRQSGFWQAPDGNGETKPAYLHGVRNLGPVLFSFAGWVSSRLKGRAAQNALIVGSPSGWFPSLLLGHDAGLSCHPFDITAQELSLALLAPDQPHRLKAVLEENKRSSLSDFIKLLGLPSSDVENLGNSSAPIDSLLSQTLLKELLSSPLAEKIYAVATARRKEIIKNLKQKGLFDKERVFLIDFNPTQTIQGHLQTLLIMEGLSTNIVGYYLASSRHALNIQRNGGEVEGYLAQNGNPNDLTELYNRLASLFTNLAAAPDTAFICQGLTDFANRFSEILRRDSFSLSYSDKNWRQQIGDILKQTLVSASCKQQAISVPLSINTPPPFPPHLSQEEKARLSVLCDNAFQDHLATGDLDYETWINLFLEPSLEGRIYIYSRLATLFRESGNTAHVEGLLNKVWRLGERGYALFKEIWSIYEKREPNPDIQQFLREALDASIQANDPTYLIDVQDALHITGYRCYYARMSYTPFQDTSLINGLKKLLPPLQLPIRQPLEKRPLRLCYIIVGEISEKYDPVCDSAFSLAEVHDADRVEISFASVNRESEVMAFQRAGNRIRDQRKQGRKTFFWPEETPGCTHYTDLLKFANRLVDENFDAIVFSSITGLRQPLAALRPAPLMVGLEFCDIDIYTSPLLDFVANWSDYSVMDGFCRSYRVQDTMPDARFRIPEKPLSREEVGIPTDAPIVLTSGRPIKYQSALYWQTVQNILEARPQTHFIFVGPLYEPMKPWFEPHVSPEYYSKLHFLGQRDDHAEVLACADVILDTFPRGGGFNLTESMHLGLPCIICRNKVEDLFDLYTNEKKMPIGEIMQEKGLSFEWDDVNGITQATIRLIDNPEERKAWAPIMRDIAARRLDMKRTADALEALIRKHLDQQVNL